MAVERRSMQDSAEQTGAPLEDFTFYARRSAGGVGPEEINTPRAQQFMRALHEYDPGATWRPVTSGGQVRGYDLSFDASKLPAVGGGDAHLANWSSGGNSGADYLPQFVTVNTPEWMQSVKDPSQIAQDAAYGPVTSYKNINYDDSGDMLFRMLGLGGVGLFAAGIPALASAMSNGAIGGGGLFGLGAGGGAPSGEMLPMMPTTDPYVPMLPFNPADPSYAITAGATGGGGLSGAELLPLIPNANPYDIMLGQPYALGGGAGLDQTLLPLIPNPNPYNPMLPFNPADPSYSGLPHGLWDRIRNTMGKIPAGGLPGMGGTGAEGLLGGGGGGAGRSGGGYPYEDALAILARFYGLPEEAAKRTAKAIADKGDHHGSYF
jgi:hypothetical protein